MKRAMIGWCAWFTLALSIAQAVPARPLYVPTEPSKPQPLVMLIGTTWRGKLFSDGEQITFHADGTLTYGFGKGGESPGSWKLTGNQLHFEVNKYSEYQTTVTGDTIQGNGWNKAGQKTQPFLQRMPAQIDKRDW